MELQREIAALNELQNEYRCRADLTIGETSISEKTMTPLIAASAVGKSSICKHILRLADEQGIDASEAHTDTTRPRRQDDGDTYRTDVSHEEMIARIKGGEYPNWSVTPSGHIYATPPESLKSEHNFLPCLPSSLPMLQRAGFKAINAFYFVTTAKAWDDQLEARKGLPDFPGRIEEAKSSLEFAWRTHNLQKLFNEPGEDNIVELARAVLAFSARGDQYLSNQFDTGWMKQNFEKHSREMYSWAIDLSNEY